MTTKKTMPLNPTLSDDDRALVATLRHGPGGLLSVSPAGSHRREAVAALVECGIEAPAPVRDAAAMLERGLQRQQTAGAALAPPPFTPGDLLAEDWRERWREHHAAAAAAQGFTQAFAGAVDGLAVALSQACEDALPTMVDELESWFETHYDTLATAVRAAARRGGPDPSHEALAAHERFLRTHGAAMKAAGGHLPLGRLDYRARWWVTHTWTAATWQRLVDSTGPELSCPEGRELQLAAECGATVRLARSLSQPWSDYSALAQAEDRAAVGRSNEQPGTGAQFWRAARENLTVS